jgi:TonB family protein
VYGVLRVRRPAGRVAACLAGALIALTSPATGPAAPPMGPVQPTPQPAGTMPPPMPLRSPAPSFASPAPQSGLTTLQQFDEKLNALHESSWRLHSTLPNFKDPRGRTAAQDVDQWLLSAENEARLEALRGTAQEQSAKGDSKGLSATLNTATPLLDQEIYRSNVLTAYWSFEELMVRHLRNLFAITQRLALPPTDIKAPAVDMIAGRLGRDLTAAMAADSPGLRSDWMTILQNGSRDLLHAMNEVREHYAAQLSEHERADGKEPVAARDTPCPEPAPRTSGAEKPSLAAGNQAPDSFYPDSSRRAEFEGSVTMQAWVSSTGCMQKAGIYSSSGVVELDDAAVRWTQQAKFYPAEHDHQAVDADMLFVLRFQMRN